MTYDLHPAAFVALGAMLMLTVCLTSVVLYAWSSIGAHVAKALTEAGKRAVDEALQKPSARDDRGEHVLVQEQPLLPSVHVRETEP
jgi:hypothetical protein